MPQRIDGSSFEYSSEIPYGTLKGRANPNAISENREELTEIAGRVRDLEDGLESTGLSLDERVEELEAAVEDLPLGLADHVRVDNTSQEDRRLQAARRSKLLAEARLLNARARVLEQDLETIPELEERLEAVEEKVEALLTQDHAVSQWGRRIETTLAGCLKRNELPNRLRGLSVDGRPVTSLTGLLRALVSQVGEIDERLDGHEQALERLDDRGTTDRRSL